MSAISRQLCDCQQKKLLAWSDAKCKRNSYFGKACILEIQKVGIICKGLPIIKTSLTPQKDNAFNNRRTKFYCLYVGYLQISIVMIFYV